MNNHIQFMELCLTLAGVARKNGKTAVGAILVKEGVVISEGIEGGNDLPHILAHAEVLAITRAIATLGHDDLSDCTLYTTVEPCYMCSFMIREARIKEVIYGVEAGSIGGAASNYPILLANDIPRWKFVPYIVSGILREECMKILLHGKLK